MAKMPPMPPLPSNMSEKGPPKEIPTGPSPDKKGVSQTVCDILYVWSFFRRVIFV